MTLIGNRYELHESVGQGGMGEVYRATDTITGDIVAVKSLKRDVVAADPEMVERFTREAIALRKLNHPNIVKVLATLQEDDGHYLIMEFVGGGSLRDLLKKEQQLPIERVLQIGLDLADALTRAHRLEIIHRDIKPPNVLIADDGTPRLTDFGVARIGDRTQMTETGSLLGTYAYLSPEACQGEHLDERADIWAFGVMLYEMLAGRRPFDENQPAAIILAIINRPVPDLLQFRPDVPRPLYNLINRMLEKDRDVRISSVRLIGTQLDMMVRWDRKEAEDDPTPSPSGRFNTPTKSEVVATTKALKQSLSSGTPSNTNDFLEMDDEPLAFSQPDMREATPVTATVPPLQAAAPAVQQQRTTRRQQRGLAVVVLLVAVAIVAGMFFVLSSDEISDDETTPAISVVEPVGEGNYMVLVAELEPRGDVERPNGRSIVDELTATLERGVPFSNYRIRYYPQVISSEDEAAEVAMANGATVVIWGNYDETITEVNLQIGVLDAFPESALERDLLEETANVRVRLSDLRNESLAPQVLVISQVLATSATNSFDIIRNLSILDEIEVGEGEILDNNVASHLHRYFQTFFTNEQQSLTSINSALELAPGNPIPYLFRSVIHQRQENFELFRQDIDTAERLGPENWFAVPYSRANQLVFVEQEYEASIAQYELMTAQREDWLAHTFLGVAYYLLGDYEQASVNVNRALELEPATNWPHIFALILALRDERILDSQELVETIIREYPDPSFATRAVENYFGLESVAWYGAIFEASGNLVLGRYSEALPDFEQAIEAQPQLSDLHAYAGFAHCNLGDFEAAIESLTRAIELDPEPVYYALRASIYVETNEFGLALLDIDAATADEVPPDFQAMTEAGMSGEVTCRNFFNAELPE